MPPSRRSPGVDGQHHDPHRAAVDAIEVDQFGDQAAHNGPGAGSFPVRSGGRMVNSGGGPNVRADSASAYCSGALKASGNAAAGSNAAARSQHRRKTPARSPRIAGEDRGRDRDDGGADGPARLDSRRLRVPGSRMVDTERVTAAQHQTGGWTVNRAVLRPGPRRRGQARPGRGRRSQGSCSPTTARWRRGTRGRTARGYRRAWWTG